MVDASLLFRYNIIREVLMCKIVRQSDNWVVETCSTREEADKKIIFFDTEEDPHVILCEELE